MKAIYHGNDVSLVQERHYRRAELSPIGDGPWLELRPPRYAWVPVVVLTAVALLVRHPSQGAWLAIGLGLGVCLLATGCWEASRRRVQVCPACLGEGARGATRCRHCRYTSLSDGAVHA